MSKPLVVVAMGSESDLEKMRPAAEVLTEELIARVYAAQVTVTEGPGGHPIVTAVRPEPAS